MNNDKFYNFSATKLNGDELPLSSLKGKLILIVNTASLCGFTVQYAGLEELYNKYKNQGLEILGFPCDQFGNQEPGGNEEIAEFCHINYGVSFPMMAKIEVNGPKTAPLFNYLKKSQRGFLGSRIKWNFTKFLIDRQGYVVERFAPFTKPQAITGIIEKYLDT